MVARATWTVDGDSSFAAVLQCVGKGEEASNASTAAGATNRNKAETLDNAGNELAVERLRDEDLDTQISIPVGGEQQGIVPERIEIRTRSPIGRARTGGSDGVEMEGKAEEADGGNNKGWKNEEHEALLAGEGRDR